MTAHPPSRPQVTPERAFLFLVLMLVLLVIGGTIVHLLRTATTGHTVISNNQFRQQLADRQVMSVVIIGDEATVRLDNNFEETFQTALPAGWKADKKFQALLFPPPAAPGGNPHPRVELIQPGANFLVNFLAFAFPILVLLVIVGAFLFAGAVKRRDEVRQRDTVQVPKTVTHSPWEKER